jgi:S-phase kinase-associated protein 1
MTEEETVNLVRLTASRGLRKLAPPPSIPSCCSLPSSLLVSCNVQCAICVLAIIALIIIDIVTLVLLQVSKEGEAFPVSITVAKMSNLVVDTLGEDEDEDEEDCVDAKDIPLPNVTAVVLQKVIDFCEHYRQIEEMIPIQTPLKSAKLEDLVQPWYSDFVKIDKNMLFDLVAAANFMDIKPLLDLTCLAVSILIKGKSATELREMFNISSEFTPDEQAHAQRENNWADQNAGNNNTNNTTSPTNQQPAASDP